MGGNLAVPKPTGIETLPSILIQPKGIGGPVIRAGDHRTRGHFIPTVRLGRLTFWMRVIDGKTH